MIPIFKRKRLGVGGMTDDLGDLQTNKEVRETKVRHFSLVVQSLPPNRGLWMISEDKSEGVKKMMRFVVLTLKR